MAVTQLEVLLSQLDELAEDYEIALDEKAALEDENETLLDLLEALFFFARSEVERERFNRFVDEHEQLGRMFPVVKSDG